MFDFHEKRKIRSFVYSRPVVLLLLLVSIFFLHSVYNRYTVAQDMQAKLEARKVELLDLQTRAQAIESRVEYLENERGVEEELRNRFDVIKEGEQMIVLLDEKREKEEGPHTEVTSGNSLALPKSFFDFLKFWE